MSKKTVSIEILSFSGCPNVRLTHDRLHQALKVAGVNADVRAIEVDTAEKAAALRFLGSPTVRINGHDIELEARGRGDYGIMCRTYGTTDAMEGAPPVSMILDALRAAM